MLSEMAVRRSSGRGTVREGVVGRGESRWMEEEGRSYVGIAALTRMGPVLLSVAISSRWWSRVEVSGQRLRGGIVGEFAGLSNFLVLQGKKNIFLVPISFFDARRPIMTC